MQSGDQGYRTFRLDNGMRVNCIVNRSVPLAEIHLYVRTGYAWETDPLHGLSHVVEHNLMHASPARPTREDFSRDRRAMGAWYDAGTTYDYTEYLMIVPGKHLRGAMEMLADGFFSARFADDIFQSEMGAILQESRRKQDIPEPMVLEKLYSAAYRVDRKRRWRLGTEESLGRITLQDLKTYFRDRYGPGNIVCTVGGDIDPDEVQQMVLEIFGPVPAAEVRGESPPKEPLQSGVRVLEIPSSLGRVYWICGFHTPSFLLEDGYWAFDLLAAVLGGGRGSRLVSRVLDKGLVDRIEARAPEFDEYMLFNVYAETDLERLAQAEEAILSEIFALACHEVVPQEFRRARTFVESRVLMRQDDLRSHVEWLAMCEGRGGSIKHVDMYAELIAGASPGDLRKAAEAHFQIPNLSVCMLRPQEAPSRDPAAVEAAAERAFKRAKEMTAVLAHGPESGIEIPAAISSGILSPPGEPVKSEFENGATLVFVPAPDNPTFALSALVRGGRFHESREVAGITDLMESCLLRGTAKRSAEQLAGAVEDLGVRLLPRVTDDAFGFTLYGPGASFRPACDLLGEILTEPAFASEDVTKEVRRLKGRIRGLADRPRDYSLEIFRQELFGDHPYGLPRPGIESVLDGLGSAALGTWFAERMAGRNLVLSLSGEFVAEEAADALRKSLGGIPAGGAAQPPPFDAGSLPVPRERRVEKQQSQTTSVVGFPTTGSLDEDIHALDLIAHACMGDGGRFYDEIRGKRGLAYVVHAVNMHRIAGGAFFGFSATAHEKAGEAQEIFRTEFQKLADAPPDSDDLARTKEFCLGMRLVRHRRTSLDRSLALAEAEIRGQGFRWELDYEDALRRVTRNRFAETARKYFPRDGHVTVVVGSV
jgi:zinc protease